MAASNAIVAAYVIADENADAPTMTEAAASRRKVLIQEFFISVPLHHQNMDTAAHSMGTKTDAWPIRYLPTQFFMVH